VAALTKLDRGGLHKDRRRLSGGDADDETRNPTARGPAVVKIKKMEDDEAARL